MLVIFEDLRYLRFFEPFLRFKGAFELPLNGIPLKEFYLRKFKNFNISFLVRKGYKDFLKEKFPSLEITEQIQINEKTFFISSFFLPEIIENEKSSSIFFTNKNEKIGFIENRGIFTCDKIRENFEEKKEEKEINGYFIKTPFYWISNLHFLLNSGLPFLRNKFREIKKNIYSKSASLEFSYDTKQGPIFIEENVIIEPFSFIKGPAFIGKGTVIKGARIYNSFIGENCRIGGEVDTSVFIGFSNKAHEGYIGHSIIGEWVNLGALTTTSDLKNNYSNVRVNIKDEIIDTGIIKFGSIIGDNVKTGIGTLLPTGAFIDCFCNIFGGGMSPKYLSPFSWIGPGIREIYKLNQAIETAEKMMKRREIKLTDNYKKLIKKIHADFHG